MRGCSSRRCCTSTGRWTSDPLKEIVGPAAARRRLAGRRRRAARGMGAVRCATARAVPGRGLWAGPPAARAADVRAHGRREAPRGGQPPAPAPITAAAGDAALVFDAELLNVRGVRARLAVLERQPLTAVHDAIQQAFGWYDDHLYSFWLDGSFFGSDEVELTTPDAPDEGVATADVPLAELDLRRRPANRLRVRLRRRLARPADGTRAGHRRAGRPSARARASRYAAAAVRGARRLKP